MSKNKIIIVVCLVVLLVVVILFNNKHQKNVIEEKTLNDFQTDTNLGYDEETGLYYVRDELTQEIIWAGYNKEDMQFYLDHPDYNQNPLGSRSTNLQDFASYQENYDEW